MTDPVALLSAWREAPRARALNDRPVSAPARYVLCWLQQALRATDNPVIDAAVRLGNEWRLPVLVYHGLREDYPYASDRLHRFILGASRDLERDVEARGLACVQFIDRAAHREKGLVYRLAAHAACVVAEDQPGFVAQWQTQSFAGKADVATLVVNAACVIPPLALDQGVKTTSAFRRRHQAAREDWYGWTDEAATVPAYDGKLPFRPDRLGELSDHALDTLVAGCAIDHTLPVAAKFPATRASVHDRMERLRTHVLPAYAAERGDGTSKDGASELSPYLHFGMVSPREMVAVVQVADVSADARAKFLDELLTWREWFHYKARALPIAEDYGRVPNWARAQLAEHAGDPRPDLWDLPALVRGETADESWNACQKQYLLEGWMHNNLRMYWAKRIIAMTPSPEAGWATANYLNDRLSLDGRDPSTWGNIAWAFGDAQPGYRRNPVYGLVPTRTDASIRKQANGPAFIAREAARPAIDVSVPDEAPADPYLTGEVPSPITAPARGPARSA